MGAVSFDKLLVWFNLEFFRVGLEDHDLALVASVRISTLWHHHHVVQRVGTHSALAGFYFRLFWDFVVYDQHWLHARVDEVCLSCSC